MEVATSPGGIEAAMEVGMADKLAYKAKSVVLIDGANSHQCARALGLDIDYRKVAQWARARSHLLRSYYFTAVEEGEDGIQTIRPLLDWLDYNGFAVVTRLVKERYDTSGNRRLRGTIDVLLAVQAITIAPTVEEVVLFSGNADFVPVVEVIQGMGRRVIVVSSIHPDAPFASDELRRQADEFMDLSDLLKIFGKERGRRDAT